MARMSACFPYLCSILFFLACVSPELPQQHVCRNEEVLTDKQLCNQERNCSLYQEEPGPPQITEEEEELCTSEEEQLVLKLETDTFNLSPNYEENDHSEPELKCDQKILFQQPSCH